LRERVVGVEGGGFELPVLLPHIVRGVVVVGPAHGGAGSDDQGRWREVKVIDPDGGRARRSRGCRLARRRALGIAAASEMASPRVASGAVIFE
jgi:hypothetical protein